MLCDLFGCERGKYIAQNKCVIYLYAKWKVKCSDPAVKLGLVSVNVDVREGLPRILTNIVEGYLW